MNRIYKQAHEASLSLQVLNACVNIRIREDKLPFKDLIIVFGFRIGKEKDK